MAMARSTSRSDARMVGVRSLTMLSSYFDMFDEYQRECLLKTLIFEVRINLIESHTEWGGISTAKENLLVDLIRTTPMGDVPQLLSHLESDNYSLFWGLYNDINSSNSDRFMAYVSLFLLETRDPPENLNEWPTNRNDLTSFLEIFKLDIPENIITIEKNEPSLLIGTSQIINGNTEQHGFSGLPFEFIRIRFIENFQFTSLNTSERIEEGEEMIVPACYAYWIIDRQQTIENWTAVRVIANVAAGIITVGVGAPILMVLTELAFNVADIGLAITSDDILSNGTPEEINFYNKLEAVILLGDIGFFTTAITQGVINYGFKKANRTLDIKSKKSNPQAYDEYKNGIKNLYRLTTFLPLQ